ncbi:DUF4133 domain-containing protein [Puia dinghuensis]|uniref:DUF4133 domain-containing protein n=1 Tax=Puia dinghuensis TaxID=1792502 RepID=A0A8J2UBA1_9BACT|nr:DUF4133 domain-containing protein [Puia dinghuensis]GGA92979.1 hypothetical protein GCM10011511_15490 [Puia dinghuensis]
MATVYEINKGINRSIEFKGIKAQYITYLALGMVALLLLFAILYICHIKLLLCLGIVVPTAIAFVLLIQHLSRTYGESGLQKRMAASKLPTAIRSRSRQLFIQLQPEQNAQK